MMLFLILLNCQYLNDLCYTSPSNANISGEQNAAQVNSEADQVLRTEGATNDPVGIEQNETNNKQEQSSLGPNIGDTQNQEASVNANKEAPSKQEGTQAEKVNIVEKENTVQGGNTPNEAKEQIIANNASTEPENKNGRVSVLHFSINRL